MVLRRRTSAAGDAVAIADDGAAGDDDVSGLVPEMRSTSRVVYDPNGAVIDNIRLLDTAGAPCNVLSRGRRYQICFDVAFTETAHWVSFQTVIKLVNGYGLAGMITDAVEHYAELVEGGARARVSFTFECRLNEGSYFFNVAVTAARDDDRVYLHRIVDADIFRVAEDTGQTEGVVDLALTAAVTLTQP